MEAMEILKTDFLDLLFENRNKAYGAYELRRSYNQRIFTALAVTCGVGTFIFLSAFLLDAKSISVSGYYIDSVELTNLPNDPPPIEVPPPPPATPPPQKVQTTRLTPPQIVRDDNVRKEDMPPDMDKIDNNKIDLVNQDGIQRTETAIPVVDDSKGIVVVKGEAMTNEPFTKVEVEPDFPGGLSAWRKFLERNLSADVATSAGAPAGSYTVLVQFIVDTDGAVSEVKAQSKHGYGLEEEAIRVIKRSGKWTPAMQNGRQVKAYRKQPVTFMVTEG